MSVRKGSDVIAGMPNDVVNSKANTSLSNLDAAGKNIGNWSSNVTDCISYIPQNIKLELSSGTLTLKAGSKLIVPNGSGVFDEVTITSDKTATIADNATYFMYYNATTGSVWFSSNGASKSGPTNPSDLWGHFYNSTDNKVYYLRNSTTPDNALFSFPFAVVKSNGTKIEEILNIFNGVGYVGSTMFLLPGTKLLCPNGINDDGSLKNIEYTVQNVVVGNNAYPREGHDEILFEFADGGYTGLTFWYAAGFYYDKFPNPATGSWYMAYNSHLNRYFVSNDGADYRPLNVVRLGSYEKQTSTGMFSSITLNNRGVALLTKNDAEYISSLTAPGSQYLNLTSSGSGQTYISPANGYFVVQAILNNSGNIGLSNNTKRISSWGQTAYQGYVDLYVPVASHDIVQLYYTNLSSIRNFNFVYAQGSM